VYMDDIIRNSSRLSSSEKTSSLGERRKEFRCIIFRLLRRGNMILHALLGHPVSENFVNWCQTLKNSSASFLCIQEHLFHLPWLKKCVHLNCFCFVYDVLTTDLGICLVSLLTHCPWQGLKTLQFHLTLTPLFNATHTSVFSLFHHFFQDLWLGYLVYSRVTLDLWLILIHRGLWNSQKLWFGFFLLTEICDQKPPLFFSQPSCERSEHGWYLYTLWNQRWKCEELKPFACFRNWTSLSRRRRDQHETNKIK
jgi:hypothetical protein